MKKVDVFHGAKMQAALNQLFFLIIDSMPKK